MSARTAEGEWADGTFCYPIRIYYEDTDVGGMTYHPRYVTFFERIRTESIRGTAADIDALWATPEADGGPHTYVVHNVNITYVRQSTVGDLLMGYCKVKKVRAAAVEIEQWITNSEGQTVAKGHVTAAIVDKDGRPRRWPVGARAVWDAWMQTALNAADNK